MNSVSTTSNTPPSRDLPAHTVYLRHGEPMPLRVAVEMISASEDRQFVALCISHYSGYVREAAIARAIDLGGSSCLELIIERVNDWVPEVRKIARQGLLALLVTVPPEHFVSLLPKIRSLAAATRTDHRSWLLEFEQQLVQAGGATAIITAMAGADFRLRRAAYFVALDHELLPITELATIGLKSGDIMVARRAVTLLGRIPSREHALCTALAAASPFGPVRHAAFMHVAENLSGAGIEPLLWPAIFDAQASLRSTAARLLHDRGLDVISHCVAMLESGQLSGAQIRAALSLLVERRAPDVGARLAQFANDRRADIRAHAMALQVKVSPPLRDEIALRALFDPIRRVRKMGVRLCALGAFVAFEQIKTLLVERGDCHAAMAVCARNEWDSLACIALIAALGLSSGHDGQTLSDALKKWIGNPRSSWTKPSILHREILSEPVAASRLLNLAQDCRTQLQARLLESGIEL